MAEDTGNALSEEREVATPEKAAEKAEQPVKENKEESGTPKESTPEKPEEKGAEPSGAEKRIRQLVAERHARDRRIAELEGKLQEKGSTEAPVKKEGAPQAKDFEDYDDYLVAKAAWKIKADEAEATARENQRRQGEAIKTIEQTFAERIEVDAVKNPDITTIRDRVGMKISTAVGFAIKQSDLAPDLIRYLDANPSEIERLSRLDLVAAAREIGKIEVKLTTKGETKKKSSAPEPPEKPEKGTGGNPTTEKSDDELPIDEYMKKFRSKGRK